VVLLSVDKRTARLLRLGEWSAGSPMPTWSRRQAADHRAVDSSARHAPVRMQVVQILATDDLALLRAESGDASRARHPRAVRLARPLLAVGFPLAANFAASLQTSPTTS